MKTWGIFYGKNNTQVVNSLVQKMKEACLKLKIECADPHLVGIQKDDDFGNWEREAKN